MCWLGSVPSLCVSSTAPKHSHNPSGGITVPSGAKPRCKGGYTGLVQSQGHKMCLHQAPTCPAQGSVLPTWSWGSESPAHLRVSRWKSPVLGSLLFPTFPGCWRAALPGRKSPDLVATCPALPTRQGTARTGLPQLRAWQGKGWAEPPLIPPRGDLGSPCSVLGGCDLSLSPGRAQWPLQCWCPTPHISQMQQIAEREEEEEEKEEEQQLPATGLATLARPEQDVPVSHPRGLPGVLVPL